MPSFSDNLVSKVDKSSPRARVTQPETYPFWAINDCFAEHNLTRPLSSTDYWMACLTVIRMLLSPAGAELGNEPDANTSGNQEEHKNKDYPQKSK